MSTITTVIERLDQAARQAMRTPGMPTFEARLAGDRAPLVIQPLDVIALCAAARLSCEISASEALLAERFQAEAQKP